MSNIERFQNLKQIVQQIQPQFDELAKIHNAVNYKKEASYALQLLTDNQYLADAAYADQDSFRRAIIHVASVGLTLNPFEKLAYLVPRKKKICFDPSYLGLLKLAQDSGSIKWAVAEIVRKNDEYTYVGAGREPIHKFQPFGDRGEVVGGYCLAKTHDGEFVLSHMTADEILSIRDRSESFKAGKSSPWITDENEMIKKTLIRRGSKSWPRTDTRAWSRFSQAIDVNNDFDPEAQALPAPSIEPEKQSPLILKIRSLLETHKREENAFLEYASRIVRREIKRIEDLTDIEKGQVISMLESIPKPTEKKNEIA